MIAQHTMMIHAVCPVDHAVIDYYEVVFESADLVKIEELREIIADHRGKISYQEGLTQTLADRSLCKVTTSGLHGTVRTVCVADPK